MELHDSRERKLLRGHIIEGLIDLKTDTGPSKNHHIDILEKRIEKKNIWISLIKKSVRF